MKHLFMNLREWRPGSGWRSTLLASLVLCAGFATSSSGGTSGGSGETIGTLPNTSSGLVGLDLARICRDAKPCVYLEGPLEQIYGTVVGFAGRAIITEEVLDASTHVVRLTFHGDVRLELDRRAFEQGYIKVGWTVPQAFGPARVTLLLGDRTIASGMMSARSITLPILAMESSGGLDAAPLSIVTSGRQGTHAALSVTTSGDNLILSQIR